MRFAMAYEARRQCWGKPAPHELRKRRLLDEERNLKWETRTVESAVIMVLRRIPQRSQDDCAICAVGMVLGYSYERVEADRARFAHFDDTTAWWEHYLLDEGHVNEYRPLADLSVVQAASAPVVGLLVMETRRLQAAHVVAIDEVGVLDPSDGFPEHMAWSTHPAVKGSPGFVLDSEFLGVSVPTAR